MKKPYLFLLVFITLGFSVPAQSANINSRSFSLGTSIGLLLGQGEKIVYRYDNSDDKLSQLLWHFEPLVYAGVDLHYNWPMPASGWNFFADGIFKFGFPGESGVMEDSDWLDVRC
jgi:outer membrane protease